MGKCALKELRKEKSKESLSTYYFSKAIEKNYYLPQSHNDQLNITFQHNYQILKFVATSIEEAEFIITVPTGVINSGSFVFLHQSRVSFII